MSGTARTIANLYTTWGDTGAPGRDSPANVRDIIATLKKRSSIFEVVNPEYGAIGDGNSHPLSGITLWNGTNTTGFTAAQWTTLLYGTATPTIGGVSVAVISTADEVDWAAHQLAIWTAAQANGGLITSPAGHYRLNQMLIFPENDTIRSNTPVASANWLGDGMENTLLEWRSDTTGSGTTSSIAAGTTTFTGSISGNTLTIPGAVTGTVYPGMTLSGGTTAAGTKVQRQLTGAAGAGSGATYYVSINQTVSSVAMTGTYGTLTVGGTIVLGFSVGNTISGTNVVAGTTITAPGTGTGGAGTYIVNNNTVVASTTITGNLTFGATFVNRLATNIGSNGYFEDLCLIGPNNSVALGVAPAKMHGLGWAEYRKMKRVRSIGFNGGFCVNSGGQTILEECEANNCLYGVYYDANNASTDNGDMTYIKLAATSCTKAAIGSANGVSINSTIFIKCFLGTNPYGVFVEAGAAGSYFSDVTFLHTQFEQFGNAVIGDNRASGSHFIQTSGSLIFNMCQFSRNNASFGIAANRHVTLFEFNQNFGSIRFEGLPSLMNAADTWTGISSGFIEVDNPSALVLIRGDITDLITNMVSGGVPFATSGGSGWSGNGANTLQIENEIVSPWKGMGLGVSGSPTMAVGNILAFDTGGNSLVTQSGGTATETLAGILMMKYVGAGGVCVVANTGYVQDVFLGASTLANGSKCFAGAAGAGTATATNPVSIGQVAFKQGTTPNFFCQMQLRGMT